MKFSKFLVCISISVSTFAAANTALAQTHSAQLSQCIVQNTTEKDRLAFIQWLAIAMLAHPDLKSFSSITPQQGQVFDEKTAAIFERILTQDCKEEFVNTMKFEGIVAMQRGFETFGAIAMEELMSNPAVAERFSAIDQYMDPKVFECLF